MGEVRDQSAAIAEIPTTPRSARDLNRQIHLSTEILSRARFIGELLITYRDP
jgi:hypothetical protein